VPAFSLRWEHRTKLLRSTQSRPPSPAFPTPEQPESLAVPADQRFRLDNDQSVPPVEHAGEDKQGRSGRVCKPSRLDLMFLIKGHLLSQEQDFSAQSRARANDCLQKTPNVEEQTAG